MQNYYFQDIPDKGEMFANINNLQLFYKKKKLQSQSFKNPRGAIYVESLQKAHEKENLKVKKKGQISQKF